MGLDWSVCEIIDDEYERHGLSQRWHSSFAFGVPSPNIKHHWVQLPYLKLVRDLFSQFQQRNVIVQTKKYSHTIWHSAETNMRVKVNIRALVNITTLRTRRDTDSACCDLLLRKHKPVSHCMCTQFVQPYSWNLTTTWRILTSFRVSIICVLRHNSFEWRFCFRLRCLSIILEQISKECKIIYGLYMLALFYHTVLYITCVYAHPWQYLP